MEEIEQQIKLLTTQIKTVSSQIETVDLILEIDFDDWSQQQKRKYGNEEVEARKQLRSEKEQLRRKEEQLLEQKTILMKKDAEGMIMKES
jgi:hypothetical protein